MGARAYRQLDRYISEHDGFPNKDAKVAFLERADHSRVDEAAPGVSQACAMEEHITSSSSNTGLWGVTRYTRCSFPYLACLKSSCGKIVRLGSWSTCEEAARTVRDYLLEFDYPQYDELRALQE